MVGMHDEDPDLRCSRPASSARGCACVPSQCWSFSLMTTNRACHPALPAERPRMRRLRGQSGAVFPPDCHVRETESGVERAGAYLGRHPARGTNEPFDVSPRPAGTCYAADKDPTPSYQRDRRRAMDKLKAWWNGVIAKLRGGRRKA